MTPGKVLKTIAISKALLETLRTLSNPERHIPLDQAWLAGKPMRMGKSST